MSEKKASLLKSLILKSKAKETQLVVLAMIFFERESLTSGTKESFLSVSALEEKIQVFSRSSTSREYFP